MRSARSVVALAGSAALVLSLSTVGVATAAAGSAGRQHVAAHQSATAPEWSETVGYNGGDQVTYTGKLWQAAWWTKGQAPGDPNGPWMEMLSAPDGTAIWTPSRSFNAGDVVLHQGVTYVAKWWTRNQLPTDPNGPWRAQLPSGTPGVPTDWSAAYEYSTGALVRHGGHLWVALWWTGHNEPGALDGPWGEVAVTADGKTVWTPTRAFNTGDVVIYQGAEYTAKWWTRNGVPTDVNGPWRASGATAPSGARAWSADAVFAAGDVAIHASKQYVATQANRDAEPGDPAGPWAQMPDGVPLLAPPAIAGKVQVGRTVKAQSGRWDASNVSFTYQWLAGRKVVSDKRAFAIPARLKGDKLRVVVTASRQGAVVGSAASDAVKVKPRG